MKKGKELIEYIQNNEYQILHEFQGVGHAYIISTYYFKNRKPITTVTNELTSEILEVEG